MRSTHRRFGVALLPLALASLTSAEPAPRDPLRGPAVTATRAAPTLVHRDFSGRVQRLDRLPEEIALELIALDDTSLAAAGAVLTQRSAAFDRLIREDFEVLLRLGTASAGDQPVVAVSLFAALTAKFRELAGPEPLIDRLAAAVPGEKAIALRSIVTEYTEALVREELGAAASAPSSFETRIKTTLARTRVAGELFGAELERASQRTFKDNNDDGRFEKLLSALDLNPEQRTAIYAKAIGFAQRNSMMEPEKHEQARLLLEIYDLLDTTQQRKLFESVIMSK